MLPPLSRTTDRLLPDPLVASLQGWVESEADGAEVTDVSFAQHSNDVAELRLDDGRRLMVKRGRFDWVARRFENSRAASRLIRGEAGLAAPEPLELPAEMDDRPLEVYWRIELPTLSQAWPGLGPAARERALASWGEMLSRMHGVPLLRWGAIGGGHADSTFLGYMAADLHERLLPALWGEWPEASRPVEELAGALPALASRLRDRTPVMVHGDVHMGNILYDPRRGSGECVGILDLESTAGGIPESDLAIAEVLHGPMFEQPLSGGWFQAVLESYGSRPDPFAMSFFRTYHLANLGFFSALVGDAEHASGVLRLLEAELERLRSI
jgi:aminoglycoside phosphotransferase (APT) family kinase protein